MTTNAAADLALSVHGPVGVLDLVVPAGAAAVDVAEDYARQAGLTTVPGLCTRVGAVLPPDLPLAGAGVRAGDVLVATTGVVAGRRARTTARRSRPPAPPGAVSAAVVRRRRRRRARWPAGSARAPTAGTDERPADHRAARLVVAPCSACCRSAGYAAHRVVAAPAFAAAAAFAVVWDPQPSGCRWSSGLRPGRRAGRRGRAGRSDARPTRRCGSGSSRAPLLFVADLGCARSPARRPRLAWSLLLVLARRWPPGSCPASRSTCPTSTSSTSSGWP